METAGFSWELAFTTVGIIVGAASVVWVYTTLSIVGGRLTQPLQFIILGILFQVTAFIYSTVFHLLRLFPAPETDFHHALMTVGMIFFVLAAKKFADLIK